MKLWLEEGIVGVALLAAVLGHGIRAAWRAGHGAANLAAVAAGGGLIALVVRSTTVDVFDINPWNFMLWLALGIVFSLSAERSALDVR